MPEGTTAVFAERQMRAMACCRYKIGIFDRTNKTMDNRDHLEPGSVMSMIGFLRHKNASGSDIFITQATGVDRALILVDDLDRPKISLMERFGAEPACVVETSPGNLQAWISLGDSPMRKELRKIVATFFARRFGGDPASTDASHYGRFSGFTNRKPQYLRKGLYPFAVLMSCSGLPAGKSDLIRRWASARELSEARKTKETEISLPENIPKKNIAGADDPDTFYLSRHREWVMDRCRRNARLDLSVADFVIAREMYYRGYSYQEIYGALVKQSPDIETRKKNHVDDYVKRTIAAAIRR
jgi:hypothetical protein